MTIDEQVDLYQDNLYKPEFQKYLDYLQKERGLTDSSIIKFKLGVNDLGEIIIPLIKDNQIIEIKRRTNPFNPIDGQKYKNPNGLEGFIFNQDILLKEDLSGAMIAEGEFDVITLDQYGIPAITKTTGVQSMNVKEILLIRETYKLKKVIIAFDNDPIGQKAMYKLAFELIDDKQIQFCDQLLTKDWNELLLKLLPEYQNEKELTRALANDIKTNLKTAREYLQKYYQQYAPVEDFLSVISVADITEENADFLVNPFIVKNGINLITAPAKQFKSMLMLDLAISCLKGESFLGKFPVQQIGKVLLLDQENRHGAIKERIIKLGGQLNKFLLHTERVYFDKDASLIKRIINTIKTHGIDLVIIDTLRRTNMNTDENTSKDVNQFFVKVQQLQAYATIIVIHHETKPNHQNNNKTTYRGSGDIVGAVDSHISIRSKDKIAGGFNLKITHENARYSEPYDPIIVQFRSDDYTYKFDFIETESNSSIDQLRKESDIKKQTLVDFIKVGGIEGVYTEAISQFMKEKFNIGEHASQEIRDQLIDSGEIVRSDHHKGTKKTHFISSEFAAQQLDITSN